MKKIIPILLLLTTLLFVGCAKKSDPLDQLTQVPTDDSLVEEITSINSDVSQNKPTSESDSILDATVQEIVEGGGVYVASVNAEQLDSLLETESNTQIILYFHSETHATSRAFVADLEKNISRIPLGTAVVVVDVDEYPAIASGYEVTTPNTFVFLDAERSETNRLSLGVLRYQELADRL